MSRIHDALRKAEAERGPGAAVDPEAANAAASNIATAVASDDERGQPLENSSREGSLDFQTLLQRCSRPQWKPDLTRMLFFQPRTNREPGMEEFRTLRAKLYQMQSKRRLKTVLIASALPSEGKSFVSANLAQVLARQQGRRVLLIDGDMRKPSLHTKLGAASVPGLTEYCRSEADEFAVMQRSPLDNLFFIPAGKSATDQNELLNNGRLKHLLEQVGPIFSWIVIDSPPVLPVSDPTALATLVDGVIMVVQAIETPYHMAQKACQEFADAPMLGVVLNRVPPGTSYSSRYYYNNLSALPGSDESDYQGY